MTKKRHIKPTQQKRQRAEWIGYVNYTPSSKTKEEFNEWMQSEPDFEDALSQICDAGYRVSVSYDEYNSAYVATLYGQYADMVAAGWNLSIRSGSTTTALYRLVFVHLLVLGGDWSNSVMAAKGDDW